MLSEKPLAWLKVVLCSFALLTGACSGAAANHPDARSPGAERARCVNDTTQADQAVVTFRETYPNHFQTVALSAPFGEGCRVLIVSEPPPHATPEALQHELSYAPALRWHRQPIGFDGWVSDASTILPPEDAKILDGRLSSLNRFLYGIDYKRVTTPIGVTPPGISRVNLHIQPAELTHWLDPQAMLTPVVKGADTTVSAVLAGKSSGVFFRVGQGLVVWGLPRPTSIDARAAEAREFGIESDLILGAIASDHGLLIVGRERNTPVGRVQPVRFETLRTLASTAEVELAQSYERNNVLAGPDGRNDWAPIYLSPELVDTEFGSLLDLADQLLKSWSADGNTTYTKFVYPNPLTWPFKTALFNDLGASSLTYNWNTRGVGAVVDVNGQQIYWVRNTGALPISYRPEGIPSDAADKAEVEAEGFFAAQEDPLLIRVVQYSALYQIFKAFDVRATPPAPPPDTNSAGQVMEEAAFNALRSLVNVKDAELRDALVRELTRDGLPVHDASGDITEEAQNLAVEALVAREELNGDSENPSDERLRLVARALANPSRDMAKAFERLRAGAPPDKEDGSKIIEMFVAKKFNTFRPAIRAFVADLDAVKKSYSAAIIGKRTPIIRTPSIVLSKNIGVMAEVTGGHNLLSTVPRLALDESGATLTDLDGNTIRIPNLRRIENVNLGKGGVIAYGSPTTASVEDVLARPVTTHGVRGYLPPTDIQTGDAAALSPKPARTGFEVEKTGAGFIIRTPAGESLHAANRVELLDALTAKLAASDDTVVIAGRGLSPDEMRGLVRSSELKLQRDVLAVAEQGSGGFLRETINVHAAKIEDIQIKQAADGSAEASMRISARTPRGTTVIGRIRMFFSRLVVSKHGQRLVEIAQAAFAKIQYQFGSRPTTIREIALELRRELRRVDAANGITIVDESRPSEAGDIIIGENEARSTGQLGYGAVEEQRWSAA